MYIFIITSFVFFSYFSLLGKDRNYLIRKLIDSYYQDTIVLTVIFYKSIDILGEANAEFEPETLNYSLNILEPQLIIVQKQNEWPQKTAKKYPH